MQSRQAADTDCWITRLMRSRRRRSWFELK
jgi:hypothetical protein